MNPGNSVVAITGGARGIGLATARAFLETGTRVAIGDIDIELAEKAAAELNATPGVEVVALPLDVTDLASFAAFLDEVESAFGALDVLVNNAGIMPSGPFVDEPAAMTRRAIDINVLGVLNGSRLAAERFVPRGRGQLINVASIAGLCSVPELATYCGTKHFILGFTEALRLELRGSGVMVSAVLPGVINTELSAGTSVPGWARAFAAAEPEKVAAAIVAATTSKAIRTVVPKPLGFLMSALAMLPVPARATVNRIAKFDQLASGADPTGRARYYQRLAEQAN